MHAKEQNLKQLLEGSHQYQVPLYQRTYSWQRGQVTQLWQDTVAQVESLATDSSAGHFLGSLVLAPSTNYVGGVSRWIVVDGQQRLTTLSLALCAMRDHLRAMDERTSDRLHRQLLVNEYEDGESRAKLLPTQADRPDYFAVLEGDAGEATGNIGDTYRLFRELLVAYEDPEDTSAMARLEAALTLRLDLVAITADADDNVHRIFESLNNTGMRLTQGDLLRNYLFMLLPNRADEVYKSTWRPMEKTLGAENLETLAYLDLVVEGYEKAARGDTYRLQVERIRAFEKDEGAVVADIERLARRARCLVPVLKPSQAPDADIGRALQRLADWGGEASWPLMLVALERLRDGEANESEVLRVADFVESYLVRRMLTGRSAAGINRAIIQVANHSRDALDLADAVHRSLSAPRRYWPTDDQVREGIDSRNFYWAGKGSQRLFVLRRLEESFEHKETIDWALADPTIEHVMPQTPGPEWLVGLTDPDDADLPAADAHQAWVHRLGNLTLTAYNSELSALPFPQKRQLYLESNFKMTRGVAQWEKWGPQQIRQRGRLLADRAVEIWPAPLEIGPRAQEDQWRVVRQILVALPEETWTTYGDIAAVVGTHPKSLGQFLATAPAPNAVQVLTSSGQVAQGFRWSDGSQDDPIELLRARGIRIDDAGRADPDQRLRARDLAELLGISVPEELPDQEHDTPELAERFWLQLQSNHEPKAVAGVRDLLHHWQKLGGTVTFGRAAQTSMSFVLDSVTPVVWPWTIYPGREGTIEIAFQYMKSRRPFTDSALREELRKRLNQIAGVRIDPARISLRPSLPLSILTDSAAVAGLSTTADWFVATAQEVEAD